MGMTADAIYLFDEKKEYLRTIVWGISTLVHAEATYTLSAEIDMAVAARPGMHIGFSDVDDRFMLFEIDEAEDDATRGVTMITATDASVAELARKVIREARMTSDGGVTARRAADAILQSSGFSVNVDESGDKKAQISIYYEKRWKRMKELETTYGLRVVPYYTFAGNAISSRRVDLLARKNRNAGVLYERESGTAKIYVTYSGAPVTRMYAIGKATGTEDPPSCVTFADVVWRKAAGDPADKPAGQTYVEDADAVALYGSGREDVYNDKNETNPEKLLEAAWESLQEKAKPQVTGSASASDVEHVPGYEHRSVRLYDEVTVRTKRGGEAKAVVIDIKRDYVRPSKTKIAIGRDDPEEAAKKDLVKTVAETKETSTRNSRSGGAASNRYIETKQLIQLNADTIQLHSNTLETHSNKIKVFAKDIEANAENIVINAEKIRINAELIATKASLEDVDARVATILQGFSGKLSVKDLWAGDAFHLNGYNISRKTQKIAYDGSVRAGSSYSSYKVYNDDGKEIGHTEGIPSTWRFTPETKEIDYLDW